MEKLVLISPCYNETTAATAFLELLEAQLKVLPYSFMIIMVNDGSTDETLRYLQNFRFEAENISLLLLNLPFNLGHQGAIHQGLLFARTLEANRFIVMDCDGEDDPRAIPELLKQENSDIVHVVRGRRSEKLPFQLAYWTYRLLFKLLTGYRMNFGHYCLIRRPVLEALLYQTFVHFPAALLKQPVKRTFILADRPPRTSGKSKMRTASLVQHAFKSLLEFAEPLLQLFLRVFVLAMGFFFGYIGFVLYHKLISGKAISGWASTLSIGLLNLALLSIGFFTLGLLLLNISHRRQQEQRIPLYEVIRPGKGDGS